MIVCLSSEIALQSNSKIMKLSYRDTSKPMAHSFFTEEKHHEYKRELAWELTFYISHW